MCRTSFTPFYLLLSTGGLLLAGCTFWDYTFDPCSGDEASVAQCDTATDGGGVENVGGGGESGTGGTSPGDSGGAYPSTGGAGGDAGTGGSQPRAEVVINEMFVSNNVAVELINRGPDVVDMNRYLLATGLSELDIDLENACALTGELPPIGNGQSARAYLLAVSTDGCLATVDCLCITSCAWKMQSSFDESLQSDFFLVDAESYEVVTWQRYPAEGASNAPIAGASYGRVAPDSDVFQPMGNSFGEEN